MKTHQAAILSSAITGLLTMLSGEVLAHASIVPNIVSGKAEFTEGRKVYLETSLGHACSEITTNGQTITFPTLAAVTVYPTSNDALVKKGTISGSVLTFSADADLTAELSTATSPALSGIKPAVDAVWNSIRPYRAASLNASEVSNISWQGGFVEDDMYTTLKFVATLPKFKSTSCISQMRVYLPTVQYCAAGKSDVWLNVSDGNATPAMLIDKTSLVANATNASISTAPALTVKRDLSANPLNATECAGQPDTLFVYPSDGAIKAAQMTWDSKGAKKMLGIAGSKHTPMKWTETTTNNSEQLCPQGQFWHAAMGHCM